MDSARDQSGAVYPKPRLTPRAPELRIQDAADPALLRSAAVVALGPPLVAAGATQAREGSGNEARFGGNRRAEPGALYVKRPT